MGPDDRVRFSRALRLTRKSDLEAVMRGGKRVRSRHIDIRWLASPLGHPRVGIVVPRHGHTAVDRNKLKRRLREIVRLHLLHALPPIDLVLQSRAAAYRLSYDSLVTEIESVRTTL